MILSEANFSGVQSDWEPSGELTEGNIWHRDPGVSIQIGHRNDVSSPQSLSLLSPGPLTSRGLRPRAAALRSSSAMAPLRAAPPEGGLHAPLHPPYDRTTLSLKTNSTSVSEKLRKARSESSCATRS